MKYIHGDEEDFHDTASRYRQLHQFQIQVAVSMQVRRNLTYIFLVLLVFLAVPSVTFGQIPGHGALEGLEPSSISSFDGTYEEGFENIVALMERYDGKGNVSLMKLGRVAMTMGKTVGKAGSAWTRKVAKAFKHVGIVCMLDYGYSSPELKDEIEASILRNIVKENLVKRDGEGSLTFDETYGVVSEDGKHVSDLIIILYGQSVVTLKGTVLASDVARIVRRLNNQL